MRHHVEIGYQFPQRKMLKTKLLLIFLLFFVLITSCNKNKKDNCPVFASKQNNRNGIAQQKTICKAACILFSEERVTITTLGNFTYSPIVAGFSEATVTNNIHPFQQRLEIASFGATYLQSKCKSQDLISFAAHVPYFTK